MLFQKKRKDSIAIIEEMKKKILALEIKIQALETELLVTKEVVEYKKSDIMTLIRILNDNSIPIPDTFTAFDLNADDGFNTGNLLLAADLNDKTRDELLSFKYAVLSTNAILRSNNAQLLNRLNELTALLKKDINNQEENSSKKSNNSEDSKL